MSAAGCGVDSSTQSTKVVLRDVDTGAVVAIGRGAHPPTEPPVSEQDPAAWWAALRTALADIEPGLRQRVVSIAVGGQQHGLVVTDAAGRPLRPAPLWNDTTSADQAARLVETFGARRGGRNAAVRCRWPRSRSPSWRRSASVTRTCSTLSPG